MSADAKALIAGAAIWAAIIPLVTLAGRATAGSTATQKLGLLALHVGIAAATPPVLSYVLGLKTSSERLRSITLALGAAQLLDGVAHIVHPAIYSTSSDVAIASAGNIFLGAGLLGIYSVYV